MRRIMTWALVALALGAGGCSGEESSDDVIGDAEVGTCLAHPDLDDATAEWAAVACDGDAAAYEVLRTVDGTLPDEPGTGPCAEDQAYDYGLSTTGDDPVSLCLQQLADPGDCVFEGRYVSCEAGGGDRVVAVLEATTDPAGCPAEAPRGRVYEEDEVVTCLAPNPVG